MINKIFISMLVTFLSNVVLAQHTWLNNINLNSSHMFEYVNGSYDPIGPNPDPDKPSPEHPFGERALKNGDNPYKQKIHNFNIINADILDKNLYDYYEIQNDDDQSITLEEDVPSSGHTERKDVTYYKVSVIHHYPETDEYGKAIKGHALSKCYLLQAIPGVSDYGFSAVIKDGDGKDKVTLTSFDYGGGIEYNPISKKELIAINPNHPDVLTECEKIVRK